MRFTPVGVVDQFGNRLYEVRRPRCIGHPLAHLVCYRVKRARGEPKHAAVVGQIQTLNQLGAGQLDTVREDTLCVPALLTP